MEHLPSSAEYTVIWEVESPYLKEDKITTIKKKMEHSFTQTQPVWMFFSKHCHKNVTTGAT